MKFTYDPNANASYIKISNKKITKTKPLHPCMVNIDFDDSNNIVGIEFLFTEGGTLRAII